MNWNAPQFNYIARLRALGHSWDAIAHWLFLDYAISVTGNAVRKAFSRAEINIPVPIGKPFSPVLDIPYRDVAVIYDIHAGYHDKAFLEQALRLSVLADVDTLVTDSDLFDFEALSTFDKTSEQIELNAELQHAGDILVELGKYFNEIYMIHANHGKRMQRRLQQPLDLKYIVSMALQDRDANVITTNREYMTMSDFLFAHPSKMSSTVNAKVPSLLALKYQKHTLTGHTHKVSFASAGKWLALEVGCCIDQSRVWYASSNADNYVSFQKGFALILGGEVLHFDSTGNSALNGQKKSFEYWEQYLSEEYQ